MKPLVYFGPSHRRSRIALVRNLPLQPTVDLHLDDPHSRNITRTTRLVDTVSTPILLPRSVRNGSIPINSLPITSSSPEFSTPMRPSPALPI